MRVLENEGVKMKVKQDKKELEEITSGSKPGSVISRRKFMSRGALVVGAAGATVAATGGLGLLGSSFASAQTCATLPGTVKHPRGTWGYPTAGLDANAVAERAYQGFWVNACCWAVVDGVIGTLQETLGSPYTNLDLMAFKFGAGGINGWGTTCGTCLGGVLCANIIAGVTGTADKGSQMGNDLMGYYAQSSFPLYTPVVSKYAAVGGTKPEYLPGGIIPTSISDSPLCHVSTSKWMAAATIANGGVPILSGSNERKERCARVAGTMARKTVELLNAWKAGTYVAGGFHANGSASVTSDPGRPSQYNCGDCHTA